MHIKINLRMHPTICLEIYLTLYPTTYLRMDDYPFHDLGSVMLAFRSCRDLESAHLEKLSTF